MPPILFQHALSLLTLAAMVFIMTGLGLFVLKKIYPSFGGFGELIFFSMGCGLAILGYSIFILGIFQLLNPVALYSLLALLAFLSFAGWLKAPYIPSGDALHAAIKPRSKIEILSVIVILIGLLTGGLFMLTPETGKDALVYHLAVPKLFLKHEGFYFVSGNIFSNYPLLNEMLFLAGLFFQGETVAKGLHFIILPFILLGIWLFARLRTAENAFPFLSFLIFLSIPSVFITSQMAYSDLFTSYYYLAALYAFLRWFDHGGKPWLILCGLCSGLAVAGKYNALFLPLLGCLGVLWTSFHEHRDARQTGGHLLLYFVPALLAGSPFYIKNLIMTGNPLYPFFYSFFGGPDWDSRQAWLYDYFLWNLGMGRGVMDYLLLPWNLSVGAKMDSPAFDGILGPVFLLTIPFLLGIKRINRTIRMMMAYGLFTFMFWASSAQQMRYLFPVFALLSMLSGYILTQYRERKVVFFILLGLTAGSILFNGSYLVRHFSEIKPIGVVIGTEDRESYLGRRLPSYGMFRYVNKNLSDDSRLFLVYMKNWGYLCDRDYYSDSVFESYTLQKILSGSPSAEDIRRALQTGGFTHLLCDMTHVYGKLSLFTEEEKRKFAQFWTQYLSLQRQEGPYCLFHIRK